MTHKRLNYDCMNCVCRGSGFTFLVHCHELCEILLNLRSLNTDSILVAFTTTLAELIRTPLARSVK